MLVTAKPGFNISLTLEQAIAAHRVNDLEIAKALYLEVLSAQTNHYDALHMLGILFFQESSFAKSNTS